MLRAEFPRRANKTAVRILLVWAVYSLPDSNWDHKGLTDNHPRVKAPGVGAREGGQGWGPRAHGLRFLSETLEDKGARADSHLGIRALRLLSARRPPRAAPRGSHGLAAGLVALLILHDACHVRKSCWSPPLALSLGQARKPHLSPLKNYRTTVPAAATTQTRMDTSHFREREACTRRAGAMSRRAERQRLRRGRRWGAVGRRRDGRSEARGRREAAGRRAREKPNAACAGLKRRQSSGCSA